VAAAEKVKRTRVPFHFNPMTSRERRVIHLALRNYKDLRSESVGSGPARAVVILPADMPTPPAPPVPARNAHRGKRRENGVRGSRAHANKNREARRRRGNRPKGRDREPQ